MLKARAQFPFFKTCNKSILQAGSIRLYSNDRTVPVDNININIREEGNGKHTVLCLPGLLGTIETDFGKMVRKMNKSTFKLVCWDPPGYGKSRPYVKSHEGDYFARDAQLLVKLMDKLRYDKFSVIGWSNGGMTGNALAAEFPDRVNKLVMISSQAYYDDEVVKNILDWTDSKKWSAPVLKVMLKNYDQEYLENTLTNYADSTRDFLKSGKSVEVGQRCSKIQCPTLVFQGDKDTIVTPKHAEYFKNNIKNCQVQVIPGGNHNLHITHTPDFVKLVEPFLLDGK